MAAAWLHCKNRINSAHYGTISFCGGSEFVANYLREAILHIFADY